MSYYRRNWYIFSAFALTLFLFLFFTSLLAEPDDYPEDNYVLWNIFLVLLIITIIALITVLTINTNFKLYDNYCSSGFIIRQKINYDKVKTICITEKGVTTRYGFTPLKTKISTPKGIVKISKAYVSLHRCEDLHKLITPYFSLIDPEQNIYYNYLKRSKYINSEKVKHLRSFMTGCNLDNPNLFRLLMKFSGIIYISKSIYDNHQPLINALIEKSRFKYERIIIIEDWPNEHIVDTSLHYLNLIKEIYSNK